MRNSAVVYDYLALKLKALPDARATDGIKGDLPAVYVFLPDGLAVWILWEYDPIDEVAFGMCDLGLGSPEMGYVDLRELSDLRGQMGLPVEVDHSIKTRFEGMTRAAITIPTYLQKKDEPEWDVSRHIVNYVGFYFDMKVEVDAADDDDALVKANALMRDEMGIDIQEYAHEIITHKVGEED